MRALKRLERMGQAIEELRTILSMLHKEEGIKAESAAKVRSNGTANDAKEEEVSKRVPQVKTSTEADLLISEISELLEHAASKESIRKSGREKPKDPTPDRNEEPRKPEEQALADPLVKDAEEKSDSDPSRDFWFSLANQKIRN